MKTLRLLTGLYLTAAFRSKKIPVNTAFWSLEIAALFTVIPASNVRLLQKQNLLLRQSLN